MQKALRPQGLKSLPHCGNGARADRREGDPGSSSLSISSCRVVSGLAIETLASSVTIEGLSSRLTEGLLDFEVGWTFLDGQDESMWAARQECPALRKIRVRIWGWRPRLHSLLAIMLAATALMFTRGLYGIRNRPDNPSSVTNTPSGSPNHPPVSLPEARPVV